MNKVKGSQTVGAFQEFLGTKLMVQLGKHRRTPPEKAVLDLFRSVAKSVPAYQTFLREHGIDPKSVKTFRDFKKLPMVTKENYIRRNSLAELCRNGKVENCDFIAVSSGSTGKPNFWPRSITDELDIAIRFEQVFYDSFNTDTTSTLAVVCFPMGTWVGGMHTANCCRYLAAKEYSVTLVTPGNNPSEILKVVQELGPAFEQVVLLGYPPFIKNVIDTGIAQGVKWRNYNIKMVFAGEVFSEEWRSLVCRRTGAKNPCYDSASLYGTADAGVLGNETPLSICIRRFLAEHPEAARRLFDDSRLPTLVQYDPLSRFFETHEGTLLFSGDSGIPLVRYHISDNGGIIPFDEMLDFLKQFKFDPAAELRKIGKRGSHPLPFVYVFGRSHFVVSYFGANIYPENLAVGLEQPRIQDWVTGRFILQVEENEDKDKFLSVIVELAPNVEGDEAKAEEIASSIQSHLLRLNSEFANYVPKEHQLPKVRLVPMNDPKHFPPGVKHRYTSK
jgi:phenylacetate-CoA ligase